LLERKAEQQKEVSSGDAATSVISAAGQRREKKPTIPEILTNASTLRDLGLMEEAIAVYGKLFEFEYAIGKIVPEIVECLLELPSPSKMTGKVEEVINRANLSPQEIGQIRFSLGLELEKKGQQEAAQAFFKAPSDVDPRNGAIREKAPLLMPDNSYSSRYDYLIANEIITAAKLQKALALSKKTRKSVEFVLMETFNVPKRDIGKSLSSFYARPFKAFDPELPVPTEIINSLKKSFLLHDLWVPLIWTKDSVEILIDDPGDLRKTGQIKGLLKTKNISLYVGIKEDIEQSIAHFFEKKQKVRVEDMIQELDLLPDISFDEEEEIEEVGEALDEESSQVVKLVDQCLIAAYRKNASDIHVEPSTITKKTKIRFRMDGVCQDYMDVPNSMARGILSRIKIMSNLDIAERRLPQDGKIKFNRKGVPEFELRLATLPTAGGFEDAVMRILAKAGAMKLDEMSLSERNLKVMQKIIGEPYGLVLAAGPTGSGKTTTLHAALGYINKPGVKIWTAEDPVEITQAGLRQVEVKPKIGLDFARVMRSFLRADPDIIMIGEMRDYETASTGIEASLTGHLVFSTLHTNSAPETVTRLLDMGLNPLNFSDAILGVLAQRLVRRLCTNCRRRHHPSAVEFEELRAEYGEELFEATGITFSPELTFYRPSGCELCSGTGYRGRIGIHELMEGTPQIKGLIKKQGTSEDLLKQAIAEGMTTLKQDGIQKVFSGLTDISEIRRVCIN
jgi:type II secretory ATPase GspE/PulE/Tfp pilus assembly ATPase PilB-like protein